MIVLDASALVDVVLDQPAAAWVLARLRGTSVCAPAHPPAEVSSAVGRVLRAGHLDEEVALAEQRQAPLVTTDARLARSQLPVDVLLPGAGEPGSAAQRR